MINSQIKIKTIAKGTCLCLLVTLFSSFPGSAMENTEAVEDLKELQFYLSGKHSIEKTAKSRSREVNMYRAPVLDVDGPRGQTHHRFKLYLFHQSLKLLD